MAWALFSSPVTPAAVFWIGSGGGLVFVLCAVCMGRCFRRCGEAQRRALRDGEYELVRPWQQRFRDSVAHHGARFGAGGRVGPSRAAYSRLPVTDTSIFLGIPA